MKKLLTMLSVTWFFIANVTMVIPAQANDTLQEDLIASDFYEAVNGEWVDQAEIPADKPMVSAFNEIDDNIRQQLMADMDAMANGEIALTNAEQEEMIEFYQLVKDFSRREKEGYDVLQPYLDDIDAIENLADFNQLVIDWADKGLPGPLMLFVMTDLDNANEKSIFASATTTILPDRSLYENPFQRSMMIGMYTEAMKESLQLVGFDEDQAQSLLDDTLALDLEISKLTKSMEELADIEAMNNPIAYEDLVGQVSAVNIDQLIQNFLPDVQIDEITVITPEYFEQFDRIYTEDNIDQIKAWLTTNLVYVASDLLTDELRQATAQFNMALSGTSETESPEDFAYTMANSFYGEVLGDYYGKTYFGQEARDEVEAIVENLLDIYSENLANNDWMSEETKQSAIEKLDAIELMIGYPDQYSKYYQLMDVDSDLSLFENYIQLNEVLVEAMMADYEEPVDRSEWPAPAHMVNAFYNPQTNSIVFPAGILNAPFYDAEQTYSENLGGIGVVIAHEITHAFDNNGSKFDKLGNLDDWWTEADYQAFEEKSQDFVEFWDGMPYGQGQVNGQLTVGENIADLGGLSNALELLSRSEEADYEEFFINYARIWRSKIQPEMESLLLVMDTHSPNKLRVNVPLQHIDEFYQTFNIQDGDPMFTPEEERLSLW